MTSSSPPPFAVTRLDYDLPEELIAQQPCRPRDAARMLVLERRTGQLLDAKVLDLPDWLRPGDLLVVNDTRVVPAKFTARRSTGGLLQGLFLAERAVGEWEVLLRGAKRLKPQETLTFHSDKAEPTLTVLDDLGQGRWRVRIHPPLTCEHMLERVGRSPLPPYIRRGPEADPHDPDDRKDYQTIFARRPGAVAAPTAGLHFTDRLLDLLQQRGIELCRVTLHVGLGTFAPVTAPTLDQHPMHSERYELTPETADRINDCRAKGGRIVTVGTTAARVLETLAEANGAVQPGSGSTGIFIYPPYPFRAVDALFTNFHLPRSTLLALIMAFSDEQAIKSAYHHAVSGSYRFFSFGDSMLIL